MIPSVLCDVCSFPFCSDSWEDRHTPGTENVHDSCCPEWECSRLPDVWTPDLIFKAWSMNWQMPSDWQARLWRAGYMVGGQRRVVQLDV